MRTSLHAGALISLLLSGAIFGFFYAWVCSTMWGLDSTDPRVAIKAMQAMNASVRNAIFAPAFFGTSVALLVTAGLAYWNGLPRIALTFASAGIIYLGGGQVLTMAINVPMNEALAATTVPDTVDAAGRVWVDYSTRWQFWNQVRTGVSGLVLLLTGIGLIQVGRSVPVR